MQGEKTQKKKNTEVDMIYSVGDATRNEEAKNWETSIEGQPLKLLVSLYTGTTEFSKLSFI